jgi:hypothetical protein
MNKLFHSINAGLLLALLFVGPVDAQTYLREGSVGRVNWVGGGTSTGEIDLLKAQENKFNLKLVFTLMEGNYLAGVNVAVRDASGAPVMQQSDTGPVLLLNLPRGAFTVTATSDGRTQTRNVQVGDRLRTEYMRWPAEQGKDFTPSPAGGAPAAAGK